MADVNKKRIAIDDLVFDEEPIAAPVAIDDLVFDDVPLEAGYNDVGNVHAAPVVPEAPAPEPGLWDKTKSWFTGLGRGLERTVAQPLLQGADNVVNAVSPVEIPLSDAPTLRSETDKIMAEDGDADMEVYKAIGKLSQTASGLHDMGIGEAKDEDITTYNENLRRVIVDQLGYKDLLFDQEEGKYYVQTPEGETKRLDSGSMKSILGQGLGDRAEIAGSIIGAKKGYGIGKAAGWKGKVAGSLLGGALGAAGGNALDQLASAIETGEKLTMSQRLDEIGKSAALDATGAVVGGAVVKAVVAGVKGVYKASGAMRKVVDLAKRFDIEEYAQKRIIDDMAKLPEAEQGRYLDALEWAKENNIKLTSTSVLDHPQIDQMVQVLARNPYIRQGVKNLEAKSRDKMTAQIFDILESAGPKASPETLDKLIKQELGDALSKRNAQTSGLYDEFEKLSSDDVVTKGKALMGEIAETSDKYGLREEGGKIIDPEIATADKLVREIFAPRLQKGTLHARKLNAVSTYLGKKARGYKMSNPKLHAYYTEVKQAVDGEIGRMSEFAGDEVAQTLKSARAAYRDKINIYGHSGEHTEIRHALDSENPNQAIHKLLSGEKALDNANILRQELGGSEAGEALLGALGRKNLDDALSGDILKSPSRIAAALQSDKMRISKRLLGEEASKQIDNMATLLEMMGRTEKLLSGAGSEIATASAAPLATKVVNGLQKLMVRLQQNRLFGKVFDNTIAQDLLTKTLRAAKNAQTPREFKQVDSYLKQAAKEIERSTGADLSDIYDKREIAKARIAEAKAAKVEQKQVKQAAARFETPATEELLAVGKVANNDDVVRLNQSIGRIQADQASPADIERYIKARDSLDAETLAKAIDRERVLKLPAKYAKEDIPTAIEEISTLRDYLMSHPELKYGNEFNPQSVNALLRDLSDEGIPRSTAHDTLYEETRSMYAALKDRIKEAYPDPSTPSTGSGTVGSGNVGVKETLMFNRAPGSIMDKHLRETSPEDLEHAISVVKDEKTLNTLLDEKSRREAMAPSVGHGSDTVPLDQADPNMLFAKGADNITAGLAAGITTDEQGNITIDPERFIMGLGGYTAAKALIKNPRVQTEVKNLILHGLEKAGEKLEGSAFDLRMKMVGKDSTPTITDDLIVQHNLTTDNIRHADRMGGLPVPSLAVVKKDSALTGFGEVTLLGDKNLIAPNRATKVYGADVYSPRYPEVSYRTSSTQDRYIAADLAEYEKMVGEDISSSGYERLRDLTESPAFRAKFLEQKGIKPKIATIKPERGTIGAVNKYYKAFTKGYIDAFELKNNEAFQKAVLRELKDENRDFYDNLIEKEDFDRYMRNLAGDRASRLKKTIDAIKNKGKPDPYATRRALSDQISKKNLYADLEEYGRTFMSDHGAEEVLFAGRNYSGSPKYVEHTLDNVIKMMKKDLVGGEGFNYGLGSVRAMHTPSFKTINQIKAHADKLVSEEAFDAVKKEMDDAFMSLAEELRPYSRLGDRFGYLDQFSAIIGESAKTPIDRVLKEYGYGEIPSGLKEKITEFNAALSQMPTEYFEANILRAVDLGEFKVAIVPKGTSKTTTDILKKKGVKVKRYDPNIEDDRQRAISEAAVREDVLFMHPSTVVGAIGAAVVAYKNSTNETTGEAL